MKMLIVKGFVVVHVFAQSNARKIANGGLLVIAILNNFGAKITRFDYPEILLVAFFVSGILIQ